MRRVRSLSASAFGGYIAYEKKSEFRIRTTGCRLNCRRLSGAMNDIDFAANYYLYVNLSVV